MTTPIDAMDRTEDAGRPVSPTDDTLTPDAVPGPGRALAALPGPAKIGRYVFLERLGEGGMGVVMAAYDPQLDRKVAIKLIHALRRDDGERRRRMEREAQAMARLSHPNVVTVYEVGEFEGQLFLAMEFVKGRDLRGWLARAGSGDWRAILGVFVQAGQGLAAAHRAGLVHRDFKPDNVFVGDDERVRVGDFGLAREHSAADVEILAMRARADAEAPALAHELTRTGAMMGTPAYMAPEQFEGRPTDARTDQFAFCAALWEALYGQRPFAGSTLAELVVSVTSGKRIAPPAGNAVPAWLRRVLDRGLSPEPGDRYPTTEAMLAALQADPTRSRRVLAGVVAVGVAVGGWLGAHSWREAQRVAECETEGASIAEVWNEDVQAALRGGLVASGVSYAETTAEKVMPYFAAQAAAWREARVRGCLDARVRGAWDADTWERSRWCLDERRMEMEALITELSKADATAAQRAVTAAAGLSLVGSCLDAQRLATLPPLPPDPARVKEILGAMSHVSALYAAARYKEGLAAAEAVRDSADELGWPPLAAAARRRLGNILTESGKYPEAEAAHADAFFLAGQVGAQDVALNAAIALIVVVGADQARHAEGLMWSRHADVLFAVMGEGAEAGLRRADALSNLASVEASRGRHAKSKVLDEQALAIRERTLGPDHPIVAKSINNLAEDYRSMEAYDEAKELHRRALAIKEKALGADHPSTADSLNNLAAIELARGAYDEARRINDRALKLREAAFGPDHPHVSTSLNNLGEICKYMGQYEQAKQAHTRALAIREKAYGQDHPRVAGSLTNLATILGLLGEPAEAKALLERALAIFERSLGPDHPHVAGVRDNLGVIHRALGQYEESKQFHERATRTFEKALGPHHPQLAHALNNLADTERALGANETAKSLYTRALVILEKATGPERMDAASPLTGLAAIALVERRPADAAPLAERAVSLRGTARTELLAESRFVLAQALWDAPTDGGRDRERALALARQARDAARGVRAIANRFAEMEAFLKDHGGTP